MNAVMWDTLLQSAKACRVCRDKPQYGGSLPHEPRPVFQLSQTSRVLLAGQAPGTRVHASGRPYTDPSGDRLRSWLGLDEATFYDHAKVAIVPMGFCFPGQDAKGGDLPPRPECKATWHDQIFAARPDFDLTLIIGRYARDYHMPQKAKERLTDSIANQRLDLNALGVAPHIILPHPSWRNTAWLKRNPWFDAEIVPILQRRIKAALGQT